MHLVDEKAQGTGPLMGLDPPHRFACGFSHFPARLGHRTGNRGHGRGCAGVVHRDNQAGPEEVAIENSDDGRGTGGDEGADSGCEIAGRCIPQEHFQICPLGLVDISKPSAGIERECVDDAAVSHPAPFLIERATSVNVHERTVNVYGHHRKRSRRVVSNITRATASGRRDARPT